MSLDSKIPTANVVVSLINKPISDIINFTKNPKRDPAANSYLFKIVNDNIVKFVHEFNFQDSGGQDIGSTITLEIVDPEVAFETTLFGFSAELPFTDKQLKLYAQQATDELAFRRKLKTFLDKYNDFDLGPVDAYPLASLETHIPTNRIPGVVIENGVAYLKNDATFSTTQKIPSEDTIRSYGQIDDADNVKIYIPEYPEDNDSFYQKLKTGMVNSLKITDLEARDIAKRIYDSAKNSQLYKLPDTRVITPQDPRRDFTLEVDQTFSEKSLSSLYEDLGLNNLDSVTAPQPYFYFYYGLGDNPAAWTGPVMAQFTSAKYDYSFGSERKSISLTFTTGYNWAAFSKLSLDNRGFKTVIDPRYRLAAIFELDKDGTLGSKKNTIHTIIKEVISDYLRACTDKNMNVEVILPDLDKIINTGIGGAIKERTITGSDETAKGLLRAYQLSKVLNDMGFSTAIVPAYKQSISSKFIDRRRIPEDPITEDNIGLPVDVKAKNTIKNLAGYSQEHLLADYQSHKIKNFGLLIGIGKTGAETFGDPLRKILAGINNKLVGISTELSVIEDPAFIQKYKEYLDDTKIPNNINTAYPLIVFGDSYTVENYFYGKKYYEDLKLFELKGGEVISTGKLTDEQAAKKEIENSRGKDQFLTDLDSRKFSKHYRQAIAAPYFLKTTSLPGFESFTTFPSEEYELEEDTKTNLKIAKIPLFKAGVKESNILDMKMMFDDYYTVALSKLWTERESVNIVINSNPPESTSTTLPESFDEKLIPRLIDQIKYFRLHKEKIDEDLIEIDFKTVLDEAGKSERFQTLKDTEEGNQEIVNLIVHLASKIKEDNQLSKVQNISVKIPTAGGPNPYLAYFNLFSDLVNNVIHGYVRTVPFYFLTGTKNSMPPVFLITEEPTLPPYHKKGFVSRVFNGYYRVFGFRHTITTSDLYSEFNLIKDIKLEMPSIFSYKKKT